MCPTLTTLTLSMINAGIEKQILTIKLPVHHIRMWPPSAFITLPKRPWILENGTGSRVTCENFKNAQNSCHPCIFRSCLLSAKMAKLLYPHRTRIIKDLPAALKQTRGTSRCCCPVHPNSTAEDNSSRADSHTPLCHQGHSSCQKCKLLESLISCCSINNKLWQHH